MAYVAHDELYSRPILDDFEQRTGIEVLAVYDTEASKTTGLVSRLMLESSRPRADVFWNNEVAQTIVLQQRGVLAPYHSPAADDRPPQYIDGALHWTGFGARARVIVYNTNLVSEPPTSILDLAKPEWRGKCAMAMPLFGTTATHLAALSALWGRERTEAFTASVQENEVAFLPGNGPVVEQVASGVYAWGLTDTDDAHGAMEDGRPVNWLLPDQEPGGLGTLLLPNTVMLIKGAPHPEQGKALIDYLLSPEVEERLAAGRSMQIPVNPDAARPAHVPSPDAIKTMPVSFTEIAAQMEPTAAWLKARLLQ